jgi:hypothetical protein
MGPKYSYGRAVRTSCPPGKPNSENFFREGPFSKNDRIWDPQAGEPRSVHVRTLGEPATGWGNQLDNDEGTAGPVYLNAFLIEKARAPSGKLGWWKNGQ